MGSLGTKRVMVFLSDKTAPPGLRMFLRQHGNTPRNHRRGALDSARPLVHQATSVGLSVRAGLWLCPQRGTQPDRTKRLRQLQGHRRWRQNKE